MKIVGIQRAQCFSPHAVSNDREILSRVVEYHLGGTLLSEETLSADQLKDADIILTMGRLPATLALLDEAEARGAIVVNPPEGIRRCNRICLQQTMTACHVPFPPAEGTKGYWLKRADASAQSSRDVLFCPDEQALREGKAQMERRGISQYIVQAHMEGDLVKFYGVGTTPFFRTFYPGDDGKWKFADEARNGKPQHYSYSKPSLHKAAERLSAQMHLPIYGGDAIVDAQGNYYVIDFNDWPSFSRCRDDAAQAIAGYAKRLTDDKHGQYNTAKRENL